ncbi:MAG TPA: lycopene cyclase family protein [Allosphingosinicella sp.]|jgi:flavin-dependent dehydrogenase
MGATRVDVAVVGAGPAGATAARILALNGLRVALIDPLSRPVDRLELIAPGAQPLLQRLQLGSLLADPDLAQPCPGIRRRWGGAPDHFQDFLRHPLGQGYVVDRARFDLELRSRAVAAGAVLTPGRVAGLERSPREIRLRLSGMASGSLLGAKVVVDATGRPAMVARKLGARRMVFSALVARQSSAEPASAGGHLQVEGESDGWTYWVEGPGRRTESWRVAPPGGPAGPRFKHRAVEASSARLDRAAGRRWLAVGDAAASFDPLTSQGLANAFSTAMVAAGMVLDGFQADCGAADLYSEAVALTHHRSEAVRVAMYGDLARRESRLARQTATRPISESPASGRAARQPADTSSSATGSA